MKIDEIKEMEAGPELNAMIATEIMGWRWDDDWGCLVPPEQTAKPSEMWTDWKVEWNVDARYYCEMYKKPVEGTAVSGIVYNGDMTKIELPDFTGDIAAAWKVLEHVTRLPRKPEDHPMPGTAFMYQWEKGLGRELWACSSEEAAAEICKMALAAVASTKNLTF